MALTSCSHEPANCRIKDSCHLKANWQVINKAVYETLRKISLADMLHPLAQHNTLRHADYDRAE